MKGEILGNKFYIREYSPSELQAVKKKLTWNYTDKIFDQESKTWREEEKQDTLLLSDENTPYFYWGLVSPLRESLNFPITVVNAVEVTPAPEIDKSILSGIDLFDFQVHAIKKSIHMKRGLCAIPTGGGKTEVILGICRKLIETGKLKRGIIVVPNVLLAEQFVERAVLRGFSKDEIGVVSGDTKDIHCRIIVAVVNSLHLAIKNNLKAEQEIKLACSIERSSEEQSQVSLDILNSKLTREQQKIISLIKNEANLMIIDEVHHLSANSYVGLANQVGNLDYFLGFSASPFHEGTILEDYRNATVAGLIGVPFFTVSQKYLRSLGLLAEPFIYFRHTKGNAKYFRSGWHTIYDRGIVNNKERNEAIIAYTKFFAHHNIPVLILIQRIEHAKKLMPILKDLNPVAVLGGSTGLQVDQLTGEVEEFSIDYNIFRNNVNDGNHKIIFASQVMDEGADIPAIGAVIMAGGGKSKVKVSQRVGRGLRKKRVGKNAVYILDFMDNFHGFLKKHSEYRHSLCKNELEANFIEDEKVFQNLISSHWNSN